MQALAIEQLGRVAGGARTWGQVGRAYAGACADGMVTALTTAGSPDPYTLGVGCVAGMAGQGAVDAITAYRNRARR